jgi:hypothetical protein
VVRADELHDRPVSRRADLLETVPGPIHGVPDRTRRLRPLDASGNGFTMRVSVGYTF